MLSKMSTDEEDENEDLAALENQAQILIACANGYGKRTPVSKFTLRKSWWSGCSRYTNYRA
jgi:DNA gyrase/topoisomerase IV subunit A